MKQEFITKIFQLFYQIQANITFKSNNVKLEILFKLNLKERIYYLHKYYFLYTIIYLILNMLIIRIIQFILVSLIYSI